MFTSILPIFATGSGILRPVRRLILQLCKAVWAPYILHPLTDSYSDLQEKRNYDDANETSNEDEKNF